jgi:hypothetical protein
MQIQLDQLPLDCLRLIAKRDIVVYRAMLMIRRFALTTIADNLIYRMHFTTVKEYTSYMGTPAFKYKLNGRKHRDNDLPATMHEDEYRWFKHGKIHRDNDLPAIMNPYVLKWYQNGRIHRDNDQPSRIYIGSGGYEEWIDGDTYYREGNKPVIEYASGQHVWATGDDILATSQLLRSID